ncbi:MAG: hypothetical protein P8R54_04545 [Myxococcota bacterium]|nr:hypothetical protein [Myxococcota bacterium]
MSGSGKRHAFYVLSGGTNKFALYIDPKSGLSPNRFKTPKLIDAHLKLSGLNNAGITEVHLSKCRSAAGEVIWDGSTLHLNITNKAGKAGYTELKKALRSMRALLPIWSVGEAATSSLDEDKTQLLEVYKKAGALDPSARVINPDDCSRIYRDAGSIDQLGADIASLREYIEKYGAEIPESSLKILMASIENMERFYDTIESWEGDSGALKASHQALRAEVKREDVAMVRASQVCDAIAQAAEQPDLTAVQNALTLLNSGDLPPAFISENIDKLVKKIPGDSRLSRMVDACVDANEKAAEVGIDLTLTTDLIDRAQALGDVAARQTLKAVRGSERNLIIEDAGEGFPEKSGQYIDALSRSFAGGKDAAIFAGRMAGVYNEYGADPSQWESSVSAVANAEVQATFDMYGSASMKGCSILEGISLLAEAGFLVESSLKLTGEAKASLGPLKAKIEGMLELYGEFGGTANGLAVIGLFSGIVLSGAVNAGAEVRATANLKSSFEFSGIGTLHAGVGASAVAQASAHASGSFILSPNGTIRLTGSLGGTIGVSAEASADISMQTAGGKELFRAETSIKAIAGLSAELGGSFAIEGGKVKLQVNLSAALAVGGSIKLDLQVDLRELAQAISRTVRTHFGSVSRYLLYSAVREGYEALPDPGDEDVDFYLSCLEQDDRYEFQSLAMAGGLTYVEGHHYQTITRTILTSPNLKKNHHWAGDDTVLIAKVNKYCARIIKALKAEQGDLTLYNSAINNENDTAQEDLIEAMTQMFKTLTPAIEGLTLRMEGQTITVASCQSVRLPN